MGASQSQSHSKRNTGAAGSNGVKRNRSLKRHKSIRDDAGYFLVKFKKSQIKIVNADSVELNTITKIIR